MVFHRGGPNDHCATSADAGGGRKPVGDDLMCGDGKAWPADHLVQRHESYHRWQVSNPANRISAYKGSTLITITVEVHH